MLQRVLSIILLSLCLHATAQNYKYVYYLDINLASAKPQEAVLLAKGFADEGNIRVDYFYKQNNIMLMSAHFTDSSLAMMDGHFKSFYPASRIENEGAYSMGLENGIWTKWDSSGRKTDSIYYEKGLVYVKASYTYNRKGQMNSYEYTDSLKDMYHYIVYDSSGIKGDAVYSGNAGTLKSYNHGVVTTTAISDKEKTEAHFEGGDNGFRHYLQNNLDANTPIEHGASAGTYQVVIRFKVDIEGNVSEVTPETIFGFGMENEAMRIIQNSPNWVPAKLFGLPVVAYRRQPITFVVAEN